jgi:long-chain acyl-CoA synthetase
MLRRTQRSHFSVPERRPSTKRERQVSKTSIADTTLEFGEYEWRTYEHVHSDSQALANYLIAKDLAPKTVCDEGVFRFACLYSKNRDEWVVSDFACILSAVTNVTLYDTLGKDAIEYIMD